MSTAGRAPAGAGDAAAVRALARPLHTDADLHDLAERIGDARLVLIGEASHGTHEFYAWRDRLTRRLVADHGFGFVAVEGDWPGCRQVHRHVTDAPGAPADPERVLRGYDRWPTWMWSNTAVRDAARWLRAHNAGVPAAERVGFHGLDVYSLHRSMEAVLQWLTEHEPDLADAARAAYACFEPFGSDPFDYARATRWVPENCEEPVVGVLTALCEQHADHGHAEVEEGRFVAEQNAAVVAGAERYYRTAVRGGAASWNARALGCTGAAARRARRPCRQRGGCAAPRARRPGVGAVVPAAVRAAPLAAHGAGAPGDRRRLPPGPRTARQLRALHARRPLRRAAVVRRHHGRGAAAGRTARRLRTGDGAVRRVTVPPGPGPSGAAVDIGGRWRIR